MLLNDNPLS